MTFNSNNINLKISDINTILNLAGINDVHPKNISIYQQAFIHKSYLIFDKTHKSYETLEFYGDSIIAVNTVQYLFQRYGDIFDEGKLSKLKNNIVSTAYLSKFAKYFNFGKFVLLSNYVEKLNGRKNINILEDCFEAFIASIQIDIGCKVANQFITFCLDNLINYAKLLYVNTNYKDLALNYFQTNGWSHPKYLIDTELGCHHKKTFVVSIVKSYDNINQIICNGVGKTKKQAEMNASYNALKLFGEKL